MKVVQELVAYFDRRGQLSKKEVRQLLDKGYLAAEAPPHMLELGSNVGASFYFRVTGATEGPLWGTDVYTGDSALAAAAVHAGLDRDRESLRLPHPLADEFPPTGVIESNDHSYLCRGERAETEHSERLRVRAYDAYERSGAPSPAHYVRDLSPKGRGERNHDFRFALCANGFAFSRSVMRIGVPGRLKASRRLFVR